MLELEELFWCIGGALGHDEVVEMVNIGEVAGARLAFHGFVGLLQQVARRLLQHHNVHAFESWQGAAVLEELAQLSHVQEGGASTGLAQFVAAVVGQLCDDSFHARGEVVKDVEQLERTLVDLGVRFEGDFVKNLGSHFDDECVGHLGAKDRHVRLVV